MLGSPNLHRGNAPLSMRLKIHDLHAQLAPLDRYGVGDMSLAITGAVRALLRRRYGPQCRRLSDRAPRFVHRRLRPSAVILSVAFIRPIR